jgi:hypothetical protein
LSVCSAVLGVIGDLFFGLRIGLPNPFLAWKLASSAPAQGKIGY